METTFSNEYDELDLCSLTQETNFKSFIKNIKAEFIDIIKNQHALVFYGFPFETEDVTKGRNGTERSSVIIRDILFNKKISNFDINGLNLFYSADSFLATNIEMVSKLLKNEFEKLFQKSNRIIPFIIGGNKIKSSYHIDSMLKIYPATKINLIFIETGVSGLYIKENFEKSIETMDLFKKRKKQNLLGVTLFACKGSELSHEDQHFVKEAEITTIWLEKNIRRNKSEKNDSGINTQAGQAFWEVITKIPSNEKVYLVWLVDTILSTFCPGVSFPAVCGGLTDEEAQEIMLISGENSKIIGLELNNFNPAVEKGRTGKFLVELILKFMEGICSRKI